MRRATFRIIMLGSILSYIGCDILFPSDSSLSGKWDCELLGGMGPSNAVLDLKEKNGKISGTFEWNDLNLPVKGTVNSKRQVNFEAQDDIHRIIFTLRALKDDTILDGSFAYYRYNEYTQSTMATDAGSVYAEKR